MLKADQPFKNLLFTIVFKVQYETIGFGADLITVVGWIEKNIKIVEHRIESN